MAQKPQSSGQAGPGASLAAKPERVAARPSRPRLWVLFAVIGLGLLLRIANLAAVSSSPFFTRPVIDGQVYDQWAVAITAGKAPAEPFYQDPLYPYFLAVIYSVFGHSFWAVYVIQLLLGIGLLWLVYDVTRRLFEWRAGVVAALLAALYEPFIFYESQIDKTALSVFLVGLFLWLYVRALGARRLVWPLAAGIALGLAALTRANLLLFAPLLPVALLPGRSHESKVEGRRVTKTGRWRGAVLAIVGVALVIVPVAVRNSILGHELLLTTTQAGQNFYIGNSEYNRTGQYVAPPWVRPHPDFEQVDFRDYADKAAGHQLGYAATSGFYFQAALRWISANPGYFLRMLGQKALLYLNNFEIPDNQDLYFFARYSWVQRLPLIGFGILFALGLAGMILLTGRSVRRWSFVVFFAGYGLSVIVFFVFSRYRLPALPALLPFAAGTVIWVWDSIAGRRMSKIKYQMARGRAREGKLRRLGGGVVLVAAGFALTMYPVHHRSSSEAAQCYVNLASSYFHEGDTTKAVETFDQALKTSPGYGEALRSLGIIRYGRQDYDSALVLLNRAAQADAGNPVTHFYLGKVWDEKKDVAAAYHEYRRAMTLAPGRVEYRFPLGTLLQKLDSLPQAMAQYDTMILLAPDNPLVRHNHAVALYIAGRNQEAWDELQTVRRLGGQVSPSFEQALRAALDNPLNR